MTKIYFSIALVAAHFLNAQLFEEVENTPFRNFFYSSSAVGDYNNDGFKDVFFTGAIDSNGDTNVDTTFNELYKNTNGVFSVAQEFPENAVHLSDSRFIDFDNDGFLDLVTTGLSYNDIVNYRQYRWRNTGNGFELVTEIPGKIYGSIDVMDLNHDGKLDYSMNGTQFRNNNFSYDLDLYLNNGGDFDMTEAFMPGTMNGDFKWIDVDNDQELDLVLNGFNAEDENIFHIYRNTGGNLELFQELPPVSDGKIQYADLNNDGFIDLIATGQDADYENYLAFYLNDGTGHFTEHVIPGEGLGSAKLDIGDLNNDGYYDFAIAGEDDNYDAQTKVFLYDPAAGHFTKAEDTGLYNLGSGGSLQIFDYDNDDSLDILVNGWDWSDPDYLPFTKLYRNISGTANAKPSAPTVLSAVQEDSRVVFSWSGSSDDKTPENILQYELSVGSEPGKSDLAKYTVTTRKWYLENTTLPENIYWSVKSIDASKVLSDASEEQNFTLLSAVSNEISKAAFYPNPVQDQLFIKTDRKISSAAAYNMAGQKIDLGRISGNSIDFRGIQPGVYTVTIVLDNGTAVSRKIVKN